MQEANERSRSDKEECERDAEEHLEVEQNPAAHQRVASGQDRSQLSGFGFGETQENPFLALPPNWDLLQKRRAQLEQRS